MSSTGVAADTPRLRLVPLNLTDVDAACAALSDPAVYAFIPEDPPCDAAALGRRWARYLRGPADESADEQWLNATVWTRSPSQVIGTVQATVHPARRTADIAYLLGSAFWGCGYGTEAVAALVAWLWHHTEVARIEATLDVRNVPSRRLLERLGFARVAFLPQADFFKGAASHEYRYALTRVSDGPRRAVPLAEEDG